MQPDVVDVALLITTEGTLDYDMDAFPLPVMLIMADLDGQARITSTAAAFQCASVLPRLLIRLRNVNSEVFCDVHM